jgi:hypothetical protein
MLFFVLFLLLFDLHYKILEEWRHDGPSQAVQTK